MKNNASQYKNGPLNRAAFHFGLPENADVAISPVCFNRQKKPLLIKGSHYVR